MLDRRSWALASSYALAVRVPAAPPLPGSTGWAAPCPAYRPSPASDWLRVLPVQGAGCRWRRASRRGMRFRRTFLRGRRPGGFRSGHRHVHAGVHALRRRRQRQRRRHGDRGEQRVTGHQISPGKAGQARHYASLAHALRRGGGVAGGAGGARSSFAILATAGVADGNAARVITPLRQVDGGMQPAQTCSVAVPSCLLIGIDIARWFIATVAGMSSWHPLFAIAGMASAAIRMPRIRRRSM